MTVGLAGQRRAVAVLIGLVPLAAVASLAGPLVVRYGIDNGLRPGAPDTTLLVRCALAYLAAAVLAALLMGAVTRLTARLGEHLVRGLRLRAFTLVLGQDSAYFDRHADGSLVPRLTADVDAIEDFLQQGAVQLLQTVSTLLVLGVAVFVLSWQLSLLCLLPVFLLARATAVFRRRALPAFLDLRVHVGRTMAALEESLAGVRVVRAFAQERRIVAQLHEASEQQLSADMNALGYQARFLPVVEWVSAAATAIALAAGGWMVHASALSLGTLTAFLLYVLTLGDPIQALSYLFTTLQSALAASRRVGALLAETPPPADGHQPLPGQGELRADDLGFAYTAGGPRVLDGVGLIVRPGERLALVGPTGAGKSTLAKLLAGLYQPDRGTVRYGGVDLAAAAPDEVRRRITVLDQQTQLFSGSVLDNLRYVRPALTAAEATTLLTDIGAAPILAGLSAGLNSEAGPGGSGLSLGQQQVLALARAALTPAPVMILDEVTAQVDPVTEQTLVTAMERVLAGRTVVLIAHRLSTVLGCDRIAVVADGAICELGSHQELLQQRGRYFRLYTAWSAGARLLTPPPSRPALLGSTGFPEAVVVKSLPAPEPRPQRPQPSRSSHQTQH